jgi:hypothetical protein
MGSKKAVEWARRDAFKYGDVGRLTETDMGFRGAA